MDHEKNGCVLSAFVGGGVIGHLFAIVAEKQVVDDFHADRLLWMNKSQPISAITKAFGRGAELRNQGNFLSSYLQYHEKG